MFEYVISGLGYTRILLPAIRDNPLLVAAVNTLVSERNAKGGVQISALFNGLVETNSGPALQKYPSFKNIFVDSGGLQAITRGMTIDSKLKTGVYKYQADYGTVGMCFDEIPLSVVDDGTGNNKKNRTSLGNKIFRTSEVVAKAEHTADNITEQLQYFKDSGTNCKVMTIMQGNDVPTLVEYIETIFNKIPKDLVDAVHGIALADTCLGNGVKETVQLCLALEAAEIDPKFKKNIHFLGVGAIKRLLPVLMLHANLFKDKNISFDSTSHSMSWMHGKLHTPNCRIIDLGKTVTEHNKVFFEKMYDDVITRFLAGPTELPPKDDYVKYVIDNITTFRHLNIEHELQYAVNLSAFAYCLHAVDLFCNAIEDVVDNPLNMYKYIRKNDHLINLLSTMTAINNLDDFTKWYAEYSNRLESKSIISETKLVSATLDEFFV